jgi:hypothetical protein
MEINEELTKALIVAAQLARPAYIAAGVTSALGAILIPVCRRTWLNKASFAWVGLFYRQSAAGCLRIACVWLKLLMLLIPLADGRMLGAADYLMLILPGLVYAALSKSAASVAGKIMWTASEAVGLLAVNIFRAYIAEMDPGPAFTLVYAMLSVFMGVFGVYLFLREIHAISAARERGANG